MSPSTILRIIPLLLMLDTSRSAAVSKSRELATEVSSAKSSSEYHPRSRSNEIEIGFQPLPVVVDGSNVAVFDHASDLKRSFDSINHVSDMDEGKRRFDPIEHMSDMNEIKRGFDPIDHASDMDEIKRRSTMRDSDRQSTASRDGRNKHAMQLLQEMMPRLPEWKRMFDSIEHASDMDNFKRSFDSIQHSSDMDELKRGSSTDAFMNEINRLASMRRPPRLLAAAAGTKQHFEPLDTEAFARNLRSDEKRSFDSIEHVSDLDEIKRMFDSVEHSSDMDSFGLRRRRRQANKSETI